jgi:hypothetical protein
LATADARPGAERDSTEMTGEVPGNGEGKPGIGAIEGTLDGSLNRGTRPEAGESGPGAARARG